MLPVTLLRLPYSLLEAVVWSIIVYWSVGFAPDAGRVRHKSDVLLLQAVLAGCGKCLCHDVCLAASGHSLVTSCTRTHESCAGPQFFWFMFILFLVRDSP